MATIADVFAAINTLEREGLADRYAIGATVAAMFGAETTRCFTLSVCTLGLRFPEEETLAAWAEYYDFPLRDGLVVVHGVPVRVAQAYTPLEIAAVCLCERRQYKEVWVNTMRGEHLIAFHVAQGKSLWGYPPGYFADEAIDRAFLEEALGGEGLLPRWRMECEADALEASDAPCYAAKRRWHHENARLPIENKVRQLLELQKRDLPLLARQRELQWWEKPWDIEP